MKPGDRVHWAHVSQRGRSVSMERREGTIEAIEGKLALVRSASNRRTQIAVARLRLLDERSQIDEFVEGVRAAHRGEQ